MIPSVLVDAVNTIILDASTPSALEQRIILRLFSSINKILRNLFGSEAFVTGAAFNNVLIPNECVEMTQLLFSKEFKHWSVETIQAISQEANVNNFSLLEDIEHQPIENIQLSVNGNFIQCQQARVRFRKSLNNIHGLLLTAAVERFNHDIGQSDLFKRSLVLIKVWIKYESRRFSHLDLAKLLQHDALVVITMMLFASRKDLQLPEIDNPLAALHCFLESFSEIDWNSFHVTVLGIVPSTNETSDVIQRNSGDGHKSSGNSRKAMLEATIDHYRALFSDNFEVGETHSSDGDSDNNSRDGASIVDNYGRFSPARLPNSGTEYVVVVNPFSPGRNLCSCCPSYYRVSNISDDLRSVFRKGLTELSAGIQSTEDTSNVDVFMASVFPWTGALLRTRRDEAAGTDPTDAESPVDIFKAICLNTSGAGGGPHSLERDLKAAASPASHYQEVLQSMDNVIARAVKVSSKRVTEESILNLVVQALHRYGPMPIGEIGKQLQVMAQNPDFPKLVKKRFGGLKKLISSHLELFNCGDNHTFNPIVYVIDQDKNRVIKEAPSSVTANQKAAAATDIVENALNLPMPPLLPSASSSTTTGGGGGHVRRNSSSSNLQHHGHQRESPSAVAMAASSIPPPSSSSSSQQVEEGSVEGQQPQPHGVSTTDRNVTYTEYYSPQIMHAYPAQPHYQYHQPHHAYHAQQYPQTQQFHQQPYPGQVYPATGYVVVRQQAYPVWNIRPQGPGHGPGPSPGPGQGGFQG